VLTRPKNKPTFWGTFYSTVTLTLDFLTPKCDAFFLVPKSIDGKSLVKFRQQIHKISC